MNRGTSNGSARSSGLWSASASARRCAHLVSVFAKARNDVSADNARGLDNRDPKLSNTKSGQDTDLSKQRGEIVVKALAGHQPVPERYYDRERKANGSAGRRVIEEPAAVDALIPGLGDHKSAVLRPVASFAFY